MIGFTRVGTTLVAELDDFEVALVTSLVSQVSELIGGGGAEVGDDPFARWERELAGGAPLDRSDPVVARLFPDAYDDEALAAEHRRLSGDGLRRGRIADSDIVLADLARTAEGTDQLVVQAAHLDAWLKTLNGVRLSLAVRLGIDAASDHDELERLPARDPRLQMVALYDWLGVVLESLLEAASTLR